MRLLIVVNKAQFNSVNTRCETHHHTINQIGVSQSPPLKSLMSSLGPTLWGLSPHEVNYRAGSLKFNFIASKVKLMNYLIYCEGDIILYYDIYKENK